MALAMAMAAPAHAATSGDTLRILFVGNSYTYYNNLPATVESIAGASGCSLNASQVTIPGGSLRQHWARGTAVDSIRSGRWDYVVLQEQGLLGGREVDGEFMLGRPDSFHAYARRFDAEARRAGARVALLSMWTREGGSEARTALDSVFAAASHELDAILLPAGRAWRHVREARPGLGLTGSDRFHPNGVGTYLTALVVTQVLCGRPSVATMPASIVVDSIDESGAYVPDRTTTIVLPVETAAVLLDAVHRAVSARPIDRTPPSRP